MKPVISRKDFLAQVGLGAAILLLPACLSGCKKNNTQPTKVDFNLDVATGSLSANGGYLVSNGVIVARTSTGSFIAVTAACTHEGTNIQYLPNSNSFICPNHGATFSSVGAVTKGPANTNLKQYNTSLTGTMLRVFS